MFVSCGKYCPRCSKFVIKLSLSLQIQSLQIFVLKCCNKYLKTNSLLWQVMTWISLMSSETNIHLHYGKYLSLVRQIFVLNEENICLEWGKYLSWESQIFVLIEANICLEWGKYLSWVRQIFVLREANICLDWGKYLSWVR